MTDEILTELRLIRTAQTEQAVMLGRVDERTKALDEKVDAHLAADKEFHDGTDKRVGALEHYRTRIAAFGAVIALVVGILAGAAKDALAAIFVHHP